MHVCQSIAVWVGGGGGVARGGHQSTPIQNTGIPHLKFACLVHVSCSYSFVFHLAYITILYCLLYTMSQHSDVYIHHYMTLYIKCLCYHIYANFVVLNTNFC